MSATNYLNACGFQPTSGGTGTWTVSAAIVGYHTPAQCQNPAVVNGGTYSYRAESSDKSQWEEGFGLYTASGTTLTRATITDNSAGTTAAINFTSAPNVYITAASADLPVLGGSNTFTGAFEIASTIAPILFTNGISGGAPVTSGSSDPNQFLTPGGGSVAYTFGFYFNGCMWSQPRLFSNYAVNFGTVLQPNGGNLSIGGQTNAPATPYSNNGGATLLTVGGPAAFATPTTKTAAYSQTVYDNTLIFNGSASITLTLLSAATYPGQLLYVKTIAAFPVISASSNVVPIGSASAGTAILPAVAGNWALLQSDGSNWIVIAQSGLNGLVQTNYYSSSATVTIPTGATRGYVRYLWGASGGSSGPAGLAGLSAPGGGAGALSAMLTGLTPGNTLILTIGAAGTAGGATSSGGAGTASTLASGTQTITTLTANGGGGGNAATGASGAGGTASNGAPNIVGQPGSSGVAAAASLGGMTGFGLSFGGTGTVSGGGNAGAAGGCIIDWYY